MRHRSAASTVCVDRSAGGSKRLSCPTPLSCHARNVTSPCTPSTAKVSRAGVAPSSLKASRRVSCGLSFRVTRKAASPSADLSSATVTHRWSVSGTSVRALRAPPSICSLVRFEGSIKARGSLGEASGASRPRKTVFFAEAIQGTVPCPTAASPKLGTLASTRKLNLEPRT